MKNEKMKKNEKIKSIIIMPPFIQDITKVIHHRLITLKVKNRN